MITAAVLLAISFAGIALSSYMTMKYYRLAGQEPGQSVVQTKYERYSESIQENLAVSCHSSTVRL
jgi:hypothetical protein